MKPYDSILDCVNRLEILDTHEHLPNEADRSQDADVLSEWLIHYFSCDLVSAGLSDDGLAQARDCRKPLRERWAVVEPYWDAARSTGYGRSLDIAARDLYGVKGVNARTIEPLNEAFVAARRKGGHYRRVLKEKCRIALSIVDSNPNCDREFFASVVRLDEFVMPSHRRDLVAAGRRAGIRVHRLEDWEETMRLLLEQAFEKGAVAVKCGLAYLRSLHFAKTGRAAAEEHFNAFFAEEHSPEWRGAVKAGKALQDYMLHACMRLADTHGWPVQVHTGIQEGNGNVITDANPVLLTNLFLEYQNVKFDLFHMGYPYVMELGNLAKNFRNVFADMAWGHIISPEAARRALVEWLDAVPANKISAFGGDYCFVDGVYGHQYLARRNVAAALAQKVADGSFGLDRAKEIARWVLVDNPARIFGLADRIRK
ncbi:MAG: amidohydrolase family protein [Planctomycetota bacterium]|nr:amidohydrolase family protein [Planctomycetota bacterium]